MNIEKKTIYNRQLKDPPLVSRKINCAKEAARIANEELSRGLKVIAHRLEVNQIPAIMVFNPLAHTVTEVVSVASNVLGEGVTALTDAATGLLELCQRTAGGTYLFIAHNLPAFCYKIYHITKEKTPQIEGALNVSDTLLENDFYRIEFEPKTGVITSIHDKALDRELVDKSASHNFNQVIYQHVIEPTSPKGSTISPKKAKLSVIADGPLAATIKVDTTEPKSGASIHQYVTLYRGVRRIDITDELSGVDAMWGDERMFGSRRYGHVGPRYKKNIFISFPLNVPDATIRAEYTAGVVRPYDDQLRLGSHDYLSVQQYLDCSNDDYGITWTTRDAPVVHIGGIHYNQFSNDYKPEHPWIYSYTMSNRLAGLLLCV